MEGQTLARIGAIVFVAVAITATAVEMTRKEVAPVVAVAVAAAPVAADPLRADLSRCQLLGEAAEHDSTCLRTWVENRARFLGAGRPAGSR